MEENQELETPETDEENWEKVEPKCWRPEKEGDTISGVFIGKRVDIGEFGSNAYDIQTKGELLTVFGSKVLDDRMRLVEVGKEVKITFKGKKKGEGKGKKPYNDFDVFTKSADNVSDEKEVDE
jgi:hypothetical protein